MANVLSELAEQLAKKVGGDDIAKGIIDGFKAQKGVTRSEVQKQVRSLIRNIDTDDAVRKAKFVDNFAEEAGGQMVIKGLGGSKGSSTVSEAVEQASKNSNEIPGQISMFADSTGQMHTPETKIRQIKEARKSTMMDNLSEGSDGQMYMNFGYKNRPEPKPAKKIEEAISMSDAGKQIEGQQSFLVDKNGNLNTEYGVQQLRQAEVDKANRSWIRKRLDGAGEAWGNLKSNVSDTITGNGDGARRIAGRNTRESARQAANQAYVETGKGSAQSKKEFYKNYKPNTPSNMGPSSNASDYTNILGASAASDVAEQAASGGINWSGISDWVHDNQLVVAGGLIGTAIVGTSLLDD